MDFNNTGAMRSPFSPRIRQSIGGRRPMGLSSSENNQSKFMQSVGEPAGDVIYKTPLITVETYGLPLPVMVTEALTFGSGDVTVRMSPCGWCWVVSGRRVLVWPSVRPPGAGAPPPGAGALPPGALAARELTLPQTDLAHKADLVYVFYSDGAQMPGCVGVSPEGVVRCWGSVGAEGVFQDASCELAGQECARLVPAGGALLLATTTCTLVLLAPCTVDGRATVRCRTLRAPSGWLGGLGRRVSHMFFGNLPHGDTRLVGVVGVGGSSTAPHVALLAGGTGGPLLQLWCGEDLHEHSLRRAILDSQQLATHGEGPGGAEVAALDVRGTAGGDLLLLLAVAAAPHVRYHIAHVSLSEPTRPVVRTLGALRWAAEGDPPRLLPLDAHALLYTATCVALASPGGEGECVRVGAEGDRILGAEVCGDRALLFTRNHGVTLLTVTAGTQGTLGAGTAPGEPRPRPVDVYDGHLTLFEIDPHEARSLATDACGKLKIAFLFHLRREPAACAALLQELGGGSEPDGPLDRAVAGVARGLVDDAPAGDPRWPAAAAGAGLALGASAALHPREQLRDKARALHLLAEFLRAAGLWARLPAAATVRALAELLAGARAACALHAGPHARVLDAAVGAACAPEPAEEAALARGALAPADLCYRRVSQLPRLLRALAAAPAPPAPAGPAPASAHAARHALACCEVLTSILSEMHAARAAWGGAAPAPDLGPRALLPALAALHRRVLENALTCSGALRAQLQEAAAALASAVLWDAAALPPAAYAALRRELILPYVEDGQTERAAALAEKFQDLELLVQLCVEAEDLPRLQGYFSKYEGMAELAYRWAWGAGGGRRALLVRALGGRGLRAWLQAAPARAPLLALHCLHAACPRAAAAALLQLATEERADRHRMATMASLSKLCAIAGAGAGEEGEGAEGVRAQAEGRLALAAAHAALAHAGGEVGRAVHSTEDLVKMFAEAGRGTLSEHAYLQAVLLAASTHDRQLLLQVWCGAVLCDEWARPDGPASVQDEWARPDGPASVQEELEGKTFYRLLLLLHATEADLEAVLPPLSELAGAPALAHVTSRPRARHLLRHAYGAVAPPAPTA